MRSIYDWCAVRPIPDEVWSAWYTYGFYNDWEIYDSLAGEPVALGSKRMMEKALVSLEAGYFVSVEELALAF